MFPASIPLILLVAAIVLAPFAVKWYIRHKRAPLAGSTGEQRIVAATALGAQSRVVTVEAGPAHARVWLVLGVTPAGITTLHTCALETGGAPAGAGDATPGVAVSLTDTFAGRLAQFSRSPS